MAGNDFGNRVARMFAASHPELTRSVILLAAGGKIPPKPDAARALGVIFNPASTERDISAVMNYLVANQADAAFMEMPTGSKIRDKANQTNHEADRSEGRDQKAPN